MEVGSLTNNLVSSRNYKAQETNNQSNFNEVLDKTKTKSNYDDNYNKNEFDSKKEPVEKTDNYQKDKAKLDKKDKASDVSNNSNVEKTTTKTDDAELDDVAKRVSKGLQDLLALLSNMFNIPVEEMTEKIASLVEEKGAIDIQGLLNGLKDLVGADVDFLSMPNMKEFLDSAKIILDDINVNLEQDINMEEILNNLVEKFTDSNTSVETTHISDENISSIADDVVSVEVTKTNIPVESEESEEVEILEEVTTTVTQTTNSNQSQNQSNMGSDENLQENFGQVNINLQSEQNINQEVIVKTETLNNLARNTTDTFKVVEQILDKMKVEVKADVSEMKIALKPAHLGDVTLKIATNNGIITAQFVAENQRVKELIESQFQSLEDTLKQQGIDVGALSVEVGSGENPNQAYERESNQYRGSNVETVEEEVIANVTTESLDESGNLVKSKIDYRV